MGLQVEVFSAPGCWSRPTSACIPCVTTKISSSEAGAYGQGCTLLRKTGIVGAALFHLLLAPLVWSHRHQALPFIAHEVRAAGLSLVAMKQTPIQLVVHLGHPVPVMDLAEVKSLRVANRPMLLLADSRYWKVLELLKLEVLAQWPVYLKKKRGLCLYRLGGATTQAGSRSGDGKKVTVNPGLVH